MSGGRTSIPSLEDVVRKHREVDYFLETARRLGTRWVPIYKVRETAFYPKSRFFQEKSIELKNETSPLAPVTVGETDRWRD